MYPPIETSDRKSSLLMLTDHCLINVFELLELVDFINLAKTSTRMQKIAYNYSIPNSLRNKPIVVTLMRDRYGHGCCNISKNELTGIFSIIGRHVSSIKVNDGDTHILETIRDTCYNLSSIELYDCEDPLQLDLQNLKELKLRGIMGLSAEDFRNCFTNNPGIESLEYDSIFSNDLIELLHMLPRLYSLRLGDVTVSLSLITNLCQLDGITKFSFRSSSNCNSVNILLEELARKWDLLELEFNTEGNARTFDIINKFQNLEVLSVGLINRRFPRVDVYPSNLKCFECDGIRISCNGFLAIVKQLQFLEEFDVGRGCIFSNLNKSEYFPNRIPDGGLNDLKAISGIADELRLKFPQRTLKILYYAQDTMDTQPFKYNTDHLKVVNRWVTDNEEKARHIYVSSKSDWYSPCGN